MRRCAERECAHHRLLSGDNAEVRPLVSYLWGTMRAGETLNLIRSTGGMTRNELMARTGLSRSTVAHRVEALLTHGLVRELSGGQSTGGRPPTRITFNPQAALILAADLGATHSRLALTDLSGHPLQEARADILISRGPEPVLTWVAETFEAMLDAAGHSAQEVGAIGMGVPGPVEFA